MAKTDPKLQKELKKELEKKHYKLFNHSAVQICTWSKKSMRDKGVCYKEKFYGVDSHRCVQFSPVAMLCSQRCLFCWRPVEYMNTTRLKKYDKPEEIMPEILKLHKKLLSGMPGAGKLDEKKFQESQNPNHFAISLSGEPTLYPFLPQLVKYLKKKIKARTVFVVTNGQEPDYFEKLKDNPENQPSQLYFSIEAPNQEVHQKINCPLYPDSWQRLNQSLELYSKLQCRRVIRLTLIKGINDKPQHLKQFVLLIKKANPDFIEVKSYMFLGYSRKRLKQENMPVFHEVKDFALQLAQEINYNYVDEAENSHISLLMNPDTKHSQKIFPEK